MGPSESNHTFSPTGTKSIQPQAGADVGDAVTALDGAADIASLGGLDEASVGLGEGAFDVGGGVSTH